MVVVIQSVWQKQRIERVEAEVDSNKNIINNCFSGKFMIGTTTRVDSSQCLIAIAIALVDVYPALLLQPVGG